ncbi:MAG: S9 family peptidase, partial [Gammaproteobacteria bacterium]|nr:S9 family peptidase [Gammaproteobacteria bacterium]
YIALPGPKDQGPYPLVIRPHGGPYARTTGNQYFITQYLVNNGYAVLKPNFRGSSGYGDAFMAAGFEQWGMKMQDDLIDGLDWMIAQGYADPQKVCIAGGSYGGYAALVAAFKTAERFKCAVSFAGVTDLDEMALRWRSFRFGAIPAAKIQSGKLRKANSPFDQVDKIGVPLLIVHGDVDRSVMIEQSRSFVAALREVGKPVEYIEQANGDHFFSLQSHRTEYLQALDSFLKKHL